MSWLIIDGYNIINQWPEFQHIKDDNLELARTQLIETMQEFCPLLWDRITIVFDAYKTRLEEDTTEKSGNVEVVFTRKGFTADAYIERLVYQNADLEPLIEVASSDYLEQRLVLWKGGKRLPARELRERLLKKRKELVGMFSSKRPGVRHTVNIFLPEKIRKTLEKWRRPS